MTKKAMLALAVAAVVAAGTGTAIAAGTGALSTTKPTDDAWVQALAKRLGTTPDKLVEALQGAANDRIDALLKAGTITQAQADALKARVAASGGLGFRGGMGEHGFGMRGMRGLPADDVTVAAGFLGMTEADLLTAFQGGKTLAQVATDKGKTAAALEDALVAAETTEINADTRLTDAQKTQLIGTLAARYKAVVENAPPAGGPGFGPMGGDGFGRHGHGMRGGGMWGGGGTGAGASLPGLRGGMSVDQLPAGGANA